MKDNTIVSLFSIGAGVIILMGGMAMGELNEAIVGISGAAIGIGAGVAIPVGALKEKVVP